MTHFRIDTINYISFCIVDTHRILYSKQQDFWNTSINPDNLWEEFNEVELGEKIGSIKRLIREATNSEDAKKPNQESDCIVSLMEELDSLKKEKQYKELIRFLRACGCMYVYDKKINGMIHVSDNENLNHKIHTLINEPSSVIVFKRDNIYDGLRLIPGLMVIEYHPYFAHDTITSIEYHSNDDMSIAVFYF